ncbi:MAG: YIP1 family protein [Candidatus Bathyarchaeota archaeon]|nr:YIP1 family protein [Candidatus Bathyarchaeota archaeon]
MSEEEGPQNTIQFLTMMIKAIITGIPQMIKSMIITAVVSGLITLALHFYLILVPNDGFNSSGDPMLDSILVLANVNPTPTNVLLFWFLGNYLFWWIIGTFKERGILGGVKQFATTPIFVATSLKESGFGAFPMLMGGLGFALIMRLWILGTMTTLQMLLMTIGVLVSQEDSITLIGMQLFFNDVKGVVNRGKEYAPPVFGLPVTLILGSVIGFAYLAYFPYNAQMVQILAGLMILGLIGMFVQGRKKGKADQIAMALMLICLFSLAVSPVVADDGGAAESGGAMNVINNPTLRDFMIKQGINPALAGIAASLVAQGKMTPKIFNQLKKGKLKPTSDMSIQEMQTMHKVTDKLLDNLQHMDHEVWFGKANKLWKSDGEKGNIREHIDILIDQIIHGKEVDINKYGKVYTVYTHHVTGKTIVEGDIPTSNQLWRETISNTVSWTTQEVITGKDIDGNTSWKSGVLRILVGVSSGGASEYVYVPANSIYTMKNYVDKGGDSIWGGFKAGAGEAIYQWGIGKVFEGGMKLGGMGLKSAGNYLGNKFPGAAKSLSNGMTKVKNFFNKEIKWPSKSSGVPKPSGIGTKTGNIYDKVKAKNQTGNPYPGVKNPKFSNAGQKADLKGMTLKDNKALRSVCDKHGVKAHMRPTTKYARQHLDNGTALPKSEIIKNKTINDIDEALGFPGGNSKGLAACKKPNALPVKKPAGMSNRQWRNLRTRHAQRSMEYRDQSKYLTQMEGKGKIVWDRKTGIVYDKATGKPFTGDNDAFAFTDAVTGKPISPYTNQRINQDLQNLGVTQHGEHINWDYSNLSKTAGKNGAQSKFATAQGIDKKILGSHAPGGEPLNTYNPLDYNPNVKGVEDNGWTTSFWEGGTRN